MNKSNMRYASEDLVFTCLCQITVGDIHSMTIETPILNFTLKELRVEKWRVETVPDYTALSYRASQGLTFFSLLTKQTVIMCLFDVDGKQTFTRNHPSSKLNIRQHVSTLKFEANLP